MQSIELSVERNRATEAYFYQKITNCTKNVISKSWMIGNRYIHGNYLE